MSTEKSTGFSRRIRQVREAFGISRDEFGKRCKVSGAYIGQLESGKKDNPSELFLDNACREFKLNPAWFQSGEGEMFQEVADQGEPRTKGEVSRGGVAAGGERNLQPLTYDSPEEALARGYVQVPRYEIAASAGGGALVHSEQIVDVMSFKSDYLKVSLGLSPKNLAVISVVGDSMEPYLSEGDLVMVDLGVTSIQNNSVYVLQFGDSLLVKRVQVKLDGEVIVKSDNPLYDPESFRGESAERLRVVGRMVRRLVR